MRLSLVLTNRSCFLVQEPAVKVPEEVGGDKSEVAATAKSLKVYS